MVLAGRTLHQHAAFRFAVYPRRGGRSPELDRPDVLARIGRFLGRLHVVGSASRFAARPTLDIASFGDEPRAFVLDGGFVPPDIVEAYTAISAQALDAVRRAFDRAGAVRDRCGCTATATPATCCGPTTGRTSSTSTMRGWAPRCRTCGCCFPATPTRRRPSSRTCSRATSSSATSTAASCC